MTQSQQRFPGESYLSLETYRRDGTGVKTTVWFVEFEGRVYIRTPATSGKAKRMAIHSRVKVTACTFSGGPKRGGWVEMKASRLAGGKKEEEGEDLKTANALFNRKYNVQKWVTDLVGLIARRRYVFFSLSAPTSPTSPTSPTEQRSK